MRFSSRSRRISRAALAALAALALLPVACEAMAGAGGGAAGGPEAARGDFYTTVYLTEAEALGVVFPEAARVVHDPLVLTPEEVRQAGEALGSRLAQRRYRAFLAAGASGGLDGYAVIQEEIGKFKPITFIVGVEPDGSVRRVAILVYRESRGGEVAGRRFLVQYEGKTVADPFSKNRDIINIQGATMSVDSLNSGVRKVLAVVEAAYRRQPGRVARLLAAPAAAPPGATPGEGEALAPAAPDRIAPAGEAEVEVREARYLMGAICEIRAFGADRRRLRETLAAGFREIEIVDELLSDYRPGSELSLVSREAGRRPVAISDTTARFLLQAQDLWRASGGAFDVTVGPLVDAWGFHGGPRRVPSPAELEALRPLVGGDKVSLARRDGGGWRAALAEPGMRLDPGALGKGFAIDRCVERLAAAGVRAALVDFSSTVYALGAPPGRDAWTVAVRDPERRDRILGSVRLRDGALAASGDAEKFFEAGGVRHGHILSPATLRPAAEARGAVVVAPGAAAADGWATAACVLGAGAPAFLAGVAGTEGLVVVRGADGGARRLATPGWERRFTPEARG